jgi:hypothetical protein
VLATARPPSGLNAWAMMYLNGKDYAGVLISRIIGFDIREQLTNDMRWGKPPQGDHPG